jgi:hypothetical protein
MIGVAAAVAAALVEVQNRQILVDGVPFRARGFAYSPARSRSSAQPAVTRGPQIPRGQPQSYNWLNNPNIYERDLPIIANMFVRGSAPLQADLSPRPPAHPPARSPAGLPTSSACTTRKSTTLTRGS